MKINVVSIFLLLLLCSSCSLIFRTMFGFNKIASININDYNDFVSKCKDNDLSMRFFISDSSYIANISKYGQTTQFKDYLKQPMQAFLFFNDSLKFFTANCLVPPKLPNLNWNYQNKFEEFPPKNTVNLDSISLSFSNFKIVLPELRGLGNYNYIYIINWNLMTERQSFNLIDEIKNNIKKFDKMDSVSVVLINTDDFYIKSDVSF